MPRGNATPLCGGIGKVFLNSIGNCFIQIIFGGEDIFNFRGCFSFLQSNGLTSINGLGSRKTLFLTVANALDA